MIHSLFPNSEVKITATPKGYILEGKVSVPGEAEKIVKTLEMLSTEGEKTVINLMADDLAKFEVLVANKDLKEGEALIPDGYSWKIIHNRAELNSSHILRSPSEKWLNHASLKRAISKGSEIYLSDLHLPEEETTEDLDLNLTISPGKIIVPLTLHPRSLILQSLNPGDLVDVKFTSKLDIGISTESVTLFSRIPVIAMKDSLGKPVKGKACFFQKDSMVEVFLEMTPQQAQIFSFAEMSGTISLESMGTEVQEEERNELVQNLFNSESARNFNSVLITHMIHTLFPSVKVKVTASSKGYIVEGNVPDPQMASKIIEIINKLVPDGDKALVNLMEVEPQQVLLRVKIFEIAKGMRSRLGLNWRVLFQNDGASVAFGAVYPNPLSTDPNFSFDASGVHSGNFNLSAVLDMLEDEGCAKVLAEPNLTTISGETAHFFSGGEFPILIPQSTGISTGTITVEYKKYGVLLDFTPNVDLNGLVTLHVIPEVSSIDKENSVTLSGFVIPSIVSRRVDTTVKLWPGQSYVIAGLFLDNHSQSEYHLYGLNKIPVVGSLFNSKKKEDKQTELVVIVTPNLISHEDKALICEGKIPSHKEVKSVDNEK